MYGNHDLGMGPYPHRVVLPQRTPGWRSTTRGAVSTRETTDFVPGLLKFWLHERISDPGIKPYSHRVVMPQRTPCWRFHTERGRIDPEDNRFCPR